MDLLDRLDRMIDDRHVLRHPFYTKWVAGTLPVEALQDYAAQYFAFESSFPRFLSALHSRTEDPEVRQALLDNLWDEEHGEANHQELWLRFAEGIGADRETVHTAPRNAATRKLLSTYRRASREAPVAAGVAAVYAYERQVPDVAAAKIDGLVERYGIEEPRTLAFFETHAVLDQDHAAAERRIVAKLGVGREEAVLAAASEALDSWWSFLSGVNPDGGPGSD